MYYDARVAGIPLPETAIERARTAIATHNATFPADTQITDKGIYADVHVDGTEVLRLWVYYRRRIRPYADIALDPVKPRPERALEISFADFIATPHGCSTRTFARAIIRCAQYARRDRDIRPYYETMRRAIYEWQPEIYWQKNLKRMTLDVLDDVQNAPSPLMLGRIDGDPDVPRVHKELEAWLLAYARAHKLVGDPPKKKRGRPYTTHRTRGIAEIVMVNGIEHRVYGKGWATPADLAKLADPTRPLSKEQDAWQREIIRQKYNEQRRKKYARDKVLQNVTPTK
jgi:hypothetical protein